MNWVTFLGYTAGLLVVLSLLPQVVKSWKTKLTRDISLWRYIVYVVGFVLWIAYAIIRKDGPVAVTNGVGLLLAVSILVLKLRYG